MKPGRVFTFAGDESGDTSFSFSKGASRYFVVAMIATDTPDEIRQVMQELKQGLKLPDRYEFKYHKLTSIKMKKIVIQNIIQESFSAWAIIVDKTSLDDSFRFLSAENFYLYFLTELIQRIPIEEQDGATLILDEFGFDQNISSAVRKFSKKRDITIKFKRILSRNSDREPLIQLADLIAGAVAHRDATKGAELAEQLLAKVKAVFDYST